MAVYVVTGKLGSGKTLVALSRIQKYLNEGRRVATNLDIFVEKLVNPWAKETNILRLPDIPTSNDLDLMGLGYEGEFKGDEHNGVIVLDECAKWLNSRSWNDKGRKGLVDWMIHARKRRWDVLLIIQDIDAMDKQMRDLFAEHVVYCRRLDRMKIPFITSFTSLFKEGGIRYLRMHLGVVRYGDTSLSPIVDKWWYRGTDLFEAYDTEQGFSEDSCGLTSILPPNTVYGRYHTKWEKFRDDFTQFKVTTFLLGGLFLGLFIATFFESNPFSIDKGTFTCSEQWENHVGCDIDPTQLKQILAKHKEPNDISMVDGSPVRHADVETPFDSIYITASVRMTNSYEYVFYNGYGNVWYPEQHGYKVNWIDFCRAKLITLNKQEIVTCTPKIEHAEQQDT